MNPQSETNRVLLFDRQEYWRERSTGALEAAGYSVDALDEYRYPPDVDRFHENPPDLVILSCALIGSDELELITKLLNRKHHLIVFCTSLPRKIMRSLFLAGADDVIDRPYDGQHLVDVVEQALESIARRDSYQTVKKEGVP